MLFLSVRNFIKEQRFLFVLFILLQITAVTGIQYTYFTHQQNEYSTLMYVKKAATFYVIYNGGIALGEACDVLKDGQELNGVKIDATVFYLSDDYSVASQRAGVIASPQFGRKIQAGGEATAAMKFSAAENIFLGDTVTVCGREYTIVGIDGWLDFCEVPYDSLQQTDTVYKISYTLKALPTKSEAVSFGEALSELFPGASVGIPEKRDTGTEYGLDSAAVRSSLLFALSLLNIMFVFRYVLIRRRDIYAVSVICGASPLKISLHISFEYLIYCAFSVIAGTLLSIVTVLPSLFEDGYLTAKDALLPAGLYIGMCALSLLPMLLGFKKRTALDVRRMKG